jgi:hypothetical protein
MNWEGCGSGRGQLKDSLPSRNLPEDLEKPQKTQSIFHAVPNRLVLRHSVRILTGTPAILTILWFSSEVTGKYNTWIKQIPLPS